MRILKGPYISKGVTVSKHKQTSSQNAIEIGAKIGAQALACRNATCILRSAFLPAPFDFGRFCSLKAALLRP
jgi:hypothetical protein